MRVLPNMVVIAPVDSIEAFKATLAMATDPRPNYMRLAREATPVVTTDASPFEIGKAYILKEGNDISLIATGTMTAQALLAAERPAVQGVSVEIVHVPTIKPLDGETILKSLEKTKRGLTIEEGQIACGLGSAVAELTAENLPVPIKRLGIMDRFGESGDPDTLIKHFGLDAEHISLMVQSLLS